MKKQVSWFVFVGAMFMAFPLLVNSFYTLSDTIADFIKGLGAGIIIASFLVQVWHSKRMNKKTS